MSKQVIVDDDNGLHMCPLCGFVYIPDENKDHSCVKINPHTSEE